MKKKTAIIVIISIVLLTSLILLLCYNSSKKITLYDCQIYKYKNGEKVLIKDNCKTKKIKYEIILTNNDKLNIKTTDISLKTNIVKVTSSKKNLDKISKVSTTIDAKKLWKYNTIYIERIFAYDKNNKKLSVKVEPNEIEADLKIEKTLPLKVMPIGNLKKGKAIKEVILSSNEITVYGSKTTIDNIEYIPVKINVNKLNKNKKYKQIKISKPNGIDKMNLSYVNANIVVDKEITKEIKKVNIAIKNLEKGLIVEAVRKEDAIVTVIAKGTKENLDKIKAENINASVDLTNLKRGTHRVKVSISGDNLLLKYTVKTPTVKVKIK